MGLIRLKKTVNLSLTLNLIYLRSCLTIQTQRLTKNNNKHFFSPVRETLELCQMSIDAQSFSNSFEAVHGVVKKSGRVSSIFVFYTFIAFLIFYTTIFQSLLRGYIRCPLSPPPPPTPPVCIYANV